MATRITTEYLGDGQVELTHGPSGAKIATDLPPDNGGKGRCFSPTDLYGSALSACILTIMAAMAERDGVDMKGTTLAFEKAMADSPRRIAKITGTITFSETVPESKRQKLLSAVRACPVHRSLHPDLEVDIKAA